MPELLRYYSTGKKFRIFPIFINFSCKKLENSLLYAQFLPYFNFLCLFFCHIGSETGPCSTSSSRTMIRSTLLSSWSAGSDTPESTSQSWNGPAKAPTSTQSSIFGRSWSAESQEENSATRPSCSAPYKKNGTASPWTLSEVLWSQCLEEWRLSSSQRATRLNIRPSLFVFFVFLLYIYWF